MIEGFEAGLIGATTGETRTLDLTFPDPYHNADLAGKAVRFEVTVKAVTEEVLPTVDAAFAEKFGVTEGGVETFRKEVLENMERERDRALQRRFNARVMEALETAIKRGSGRLTVYALADEQQHEEVWRFSTGLHCPESDLRYSEPTPSMFSFNSAVGACETCRGFGRVIGVDYGLVIPNHKLTLRAGAIKTIQTPAWSECQEDQIGRAHV